MITKIKPETVRYDAIEDLELEGTQEGEDTIPELADKTSNHYVDNKALHQEFSRYHERKMKSIAEGKGIPPLSNKIGEAILQIATRRSYSWNFINYTSNWKEEMIDDAVETCVKYAHNYDPEKSNNPFAYLTRIVNNAFSNRIKLEQEQTYIRYRHFDEMGGFSGDLEENVNPGDIVKLDETSDVYRDRLEWMEKFEEKRGLKKGRQKRQKRANNVASIDGLVYEDDESVDADIEA